MPLYLKWQHWICLLYTSDFLKDFYVSRGHSPLLEGLTAYRIVGNTSHSTVSYTHLPIIFRDINSTDTTIPEEVLHFTAKVKEVNDGNLLVTYVSTAEGFLELSEGDYVISKDNLQDEVQVGDTVEIWTNGIILETYPAQIGLAYRIEKVG